MTHFRQRETFSKMKDWKRFFLAGLPARIANTAGNKYLAWEYCCELMLCEKEVRYCIRIGRSSVMY